MYMDIDTILGYLEQYLSDRHGIDNLKKPFSCLYHNDEHPSMHYYEYNNDKTTYHPHIYCFSCGTYKDIFGLVQDDYHLSDRSEAFKKILELMGGQPIRKVIRKTAPNQSEKTVNKSDYSENYRRWNENLTGTSYHRGISLETLNRFQVGFEPEWVHPGVDNPLPSPRLIIPTSKYSYVARYANANYSGMYKVMNVGEKHIFNLIAFFSDDPIFVVEGEIDAMSIIDAGGNAIGLGGLGGSRKLIDFIRENGKDQRFIIALDNEANANVENENEKFNRLLTEIEESIPDIRHIIINPFGKYKDANEALMKDRALLEKNIRLILSVVSNKKFEWQKYKGQDVTEEVVKNEVISQKTSANYYPFYMYNETDRYYPEDYDYNITDDEPSDDEY